jgi:hypothetical protein
MFNRCCAGELMVAASGAISSPHAGSTSPVRRFIFRFGLAFLGSTMKYQLILLPVEIGIYIRCIYRY